MNIEVYDTSLDGLINRTVKIAKSDKGFIRVEKEEQKKPVQDFIKNNDNENQFIFIVEANDTQRSFIQYILNKKIVVDADKFYIFLDKWQDSNQEKGKFDLLFLVNSADCLVINFVKKDENQTDKSFLRDISKYKCYNLIFSIVEKALNLQDPKTVQTQVKSDIWQLVHTHISNHNILELLNLIIRIHKKLYQEDNIKLKKYEDMLKKYEVIQPNEKSIQDKDKLFENLNQYSVENFDESDLAVLVEKLDKTVKLIQFKEQNSNSANKV